MLTLIIDEKSNTFTYVCVYIYMYTLNSLRMQITRETVTIGLYFNPS